MINQLESSYYSAQRVQTEGDLRDVAFLKEVRRLEDLFLRNTVVLDRRLESVNRRQMLVVKDER